MADLSTEEYKRFTDGIEEQYNNLLTEREQQLKNVEEDNKNHVTKYVANGLNIICFVMSMELLHRKQRLFLVK